MVVPLESIIYIPRNKAANVPNNRPLVRPTFISLNTNFIFLAVDNSSSTNTLIVYFGQSKKDIRKILGKPKQIRDFEEMEMYEDFYVYYDEEDKCVGIGLYNDKKYETTLSLSMFDRNLIDMKYRHIVKLIKRNDPNSIEDDDGIISLKYGISVDPREEKDSADDICDVIHIFQKGYYDEVYENF